MDADATVSTFTGSNERPLLHLSTSRAANSSDLSSYPRSDPTDSFGSNEMFHLGPHFPAQSQLSPRLDAISPSSYHSSSGPSSQPITPTLTSAATSSAAATAYPAVNVVATPSTAAAAPAQPLYPHRASFPSTGPSSRRPYQDQRPVFASTPASNPPYFQPQPPGVSHALIRRSTYIKHTRKRNIHDRLFIRLISHTYLLRPNNMQVFGRRHFHPVLCLCPAAATTAACPIAPYSPAARCVFPPKI